MSSPQCSERRSQAGVGSTGDDTCNTARWNTCTSDSRATSTIAAASRATTCSPVWPPRRFRTARRRRSSRSCASPPTSSQPARRQPCACSSSALKILAERPDIQQLLRRERDRIPNFIEEVLRIESPVKGDFRLSRVPSTVGGVDIPAGSIMMVLNGAANRDPKQFDEPDDLRSGASKRPPSHRFWPRCPLVPRCSTGSCRGTGLHRASSRPHHRHQDRRGQAWPRGDRRYQYVPTFILRGLTELHLEFTL